MSLILRNLTLLRSADSHFISNITQKATCFNCHREMRGAAIKTIRAFHQIQVGCVSRLKLSPKTGLLAVLRRSATAVPPTAVSEKSQKIVGTWLLGCAGMCFGAVVLGGVTRLTESGLSMVDWRLIKDMKPPRTEAEWQEEFEKYKQFPEYKYMTKEKEMTLSDFKFIFYMEWGHRMWGRTTGVFFLLPALYFLRKGWISKALKPRLAAYAGLLGFQGFLGWYMVKSGLEDKPNPSDIPRVSHYRLAAHLGSAFVLYTLFMWQGLSHLLKPIQLPDVRSIAKIRGIAHGVMTAVFVTAMSGAFVAGLDAGLTYNSYPKMADRWIPDDMWAITPKWRNVFENPTFVQFNHRHLAELTVVFITGFWYMARKAPLHPRARLAVNCLLGMAFIQATLGITTLLN
ncbi:cytochrome c oxidase assembly protein COX15 homolog isoform X2 [Physella acuta]|uniref:cytochrome c oxidase assembly protein COX15 homolog isoform X2 n=1 Tax=Physella acuta TaxID=109671 RepID=UPI0027DAFA3A|nr:cytochrome c oxidase assembly protein COX15 homolog isoform X2 [Physella acuta]